MLNRLIVFTLILFIIQGLGYSLPSFSRGNEGSGGADLERLAVYVSLVDKTADPVLYYRHLFAARAYAALSQLEVLAWTGYQFKKLSGELVLLPIEKVRVAREVLIKWVTEDVSTQFILDPQLKDPATQQPRIAENRPGAFFKLNVDEWDTKPKAVFKPDTFEQFQRATSVHEFLSQPEVALETTGDFTFSSVLLIEEALKLSEENYRILLTLFGSPRLHEFYSCDAALYRGVSGGREKVWQSPIPIRTYGKFSTRQGHLDEMNGKPIIPNPNWIPGATNGCLGDAFQKAGLYANAPFTNDYLKGLYKLPNSNNYLDICYVISDPNDSQHYEGGGRILLRVLSGEKQGWTRFNYVTSEIPIEGIVRGELPYKEYQMEVSCGRAAPRPRK